MKIDPAFQSGYDRPISVSIKVPAYMSETVGGYETERRVTQELDHALATTGDLDDADALRWIVALLEVKLDWLENA